MEDRTSLLNVQKSSTKKTRKKKSREERLVEYKKNKSKKQKAVDRRHRKKEPKFEESLRKYEPIPSRQHDYGSINRSREMDDSLEGSYNISGVDFSVNRSIASKKRRQRKEKSYGSTKKQLFPKRSNQGSRVTPVKDSDHLLGKRGYIDGDSQANLTLKTGSNAGLEGRNNPKSAKNGPLRSPYQSIHSFKNKKNEMRRERKGRRAVGGGQRGAGLYNKKLKKGNIGGPAGSKENFDKISLRYSIGDSSQGGAHSAHPGLLGAAKRHQNSSTGPANSLKSRGVKSFLNQRNTRKMPRRAPNTPKNVIKKTTFTTNTPNSKELNPAVKMLLKKFYPKNGLVTKADDWRPQFRTLLLNMVCIKELTEPLYPLEIEDLNLRMLFHGANFCVLFYEYYKKDFYPSQKERDRFFAGFSNGSSVIVMDYLRDYPLGGAGKKEAGDESQEGDSSGIEEIGEFDDFLKEDDPKEEDALFGLSGRLKGSRGGRGVGGGEEYGKRTPCKSRGGGNLRKKAIMLDSGSTVKRNSRRRGGVRESQRNSQRYQKFSKNNHSNKNQRLKSSNRSIYRRNKQSISTNKHNQKSSKRALSSRSGILKKRGKLRKAREPIRSKPRPRKSKGVDLELEFEFGQVVDCLSSSDEEGKGEGSGGDEFDFEELGLSEKKFFSLSSEKKRDKYEGFFLNEVDSHGKNYLVKSDLKGQSDLEDELLCNPTLIKLPNPYKNGFEYELRRQKEKAEKHLRRKEAFDEMIKTRDNFPFMSKGVPMDGSSYYFYAMINAPFELRQRYGIEYVIKPAKCSRRLASKMQFNRGDKFNKSLTVEDVEGKKNVLYQPNESIENSLPIDESTNELKEVLKNYRTLEDYVRLEEGMDAVHDKRVLLHKFSTLKKMKKKFEDTSTDGSIDNLLTSEDKMSFEQAKEMLISLGFTKDYL